MCLRARVCARVGTVVALLCTGVLSSTHQEHPARRGAGAALPDLVSPLPPLTSAYVSANGKEPDITTKVLDFQGTIDFIFVRCGAAHCPPAARCVSPTWGYTHESLKGVLASRQATTYW